MVHIMKYLNRKKVSPYIQSVEHCMHQSKHTETHAGKETDTKSLFQQSSAVELFKVQLGMPQTARR